MPRDGTWRIAQEDVERVQEFRKCIECFLCQDVCHVLRDHHLHEEFVGPRFFVYNAALEMHPLDTGDRLSALKQDEGIGYCNITKCCTKVCPEHITITDNAIIPLKERGRVGVLRPAEEALPRVLGRLRGVGGRPVKGGPVALQLLECRPRHVRVLVVRRHLQELVQVFAGRVSVAGVYLQHAEFVVRP